MTGDQLIFNFGITLKASEQGDGVRRGTSTIPKDMTISNTHHYTSPAKKAKRIVAVTAICLGGLVFSPLSASADSWMVYGPEGSSQYCTSAGAGYNVYCY